MKQAQEIIEALVKLVEQSDDELVIGLLKEARDYVDIVSDELQE